MYNAMQRRGMTQNCDGVGHGETKNDKGNVKFLHRPS